MMTTGTRLVMPTATKLILTGLAFLAAMGPAPARGAEAPEASMGFTTPSVRLNALAPLVVQANPADDLYRSARFPLPDSVGVARVRRVVGRASSRDVFLAV